MCGQCDVFGKGWMQLSMTANVPKLGKNENQEAKLSFQKKMLKFLRKDQLPLKWLMATHCIYFVFTTFKVKGKLPRCSAYFPKYLFII